MKINFLKFGPAFVVYRDWQQNFHIATHEFFHTLNLEDIEDYAKSDKLMYHLGDNIAYNISDQERIKFNVFIFENLMDISKQMYTNLNYNTLLKLRLFLNDKTNGFKYNKAKFR